MSVETETLLLCASQRQVGGLACSVTALHVDGEHLLCPRAQTVVLLLLQVLRPQLALAVLSLCGKAKLFLTPSPHTAGRAERYCEMSSSRSLPHLRFQLRLQEGRVL